MSVYQLSAGGTGLSRHGTARARNHTLGTRIDTNNLPAAADNDPGVELPNSSNVTVEGDGGQTEMEVIPDGFLTTTALLRFCPSNCTPFPFEVYPPPPKKERRFQWERCVT